MADSRIFELSIGGSVVRAELLEDDAPGICGAFRGSMPLQTFGVNAKFAGEETIVPLPFLHDPENVVGSVAPGDIGYYPRAQTLCLFYGEIMPFASVSLFARVVPEDLRAAQELGREIMNKGPKAIGLAADSGASRGRRSRARTPAAVARLQTGLEAIWESEPSDVSQLRQFRRPPFGNTPCVLYANFDLFWGVENLHVCRNLVNGGRLTGPLAGHVAASFVRQVRSRVAHWGFPRACDVLDDAASSLESARSRQQVLALVEGTLLYVGRLQSWVDAIVPWADLDDSVRLLPSPRAS